MTSLIPWRVKKITADYLPEVYHILANRGIKKNSPEHWDNKLEETWDSCLWDWPTKNRFIQELTTPSQDIIDIGCGTGSVLRFLKHQGYTKLHGLELSQYAVNRLKRDGITMHHGKLPIIPLPTASFDVVIASEVLEHILRRNTLLKEIYRVLRAGGSAIIFVPDNCQGPMEEREHVRKYNADSLHKFLSKYFAVNNVNSFSDENHNTRFLVATMSKRK